MRMPILAVAGMCCVGWFVAYAIGSLIAYVHHVDTGAFAWIGVAVVIGLVAVHESGGDGS